MLIRSRGGEQRAVWVWGGGTWIVQQKIVGVQISCIKIAVDDDMHVGVGVCIFPGIIIIRARAAVRPSERENCGETMTDDNEPLKSTRLLD